MTEQEQQVVENQAAEPVCAAFVAIDWADKKHYWSLQVANSGKIERGCLENSPEAVEVWVAELSQRFEQRPIAVALEQRRGALAVMLGKYGQLHLYPVHPLTLSKYREAWYPSRSKDDIKDADLLLEIVTQHRDRLRRLDPDTEEMRLLQFQVENRRKLIDERTALSNRMTDSLKIYFPQLLQWFDDVTAPVVANLLNKWPTLEALQKAKPASLEKFFRENHCKTEKIPERLQQIKSAIPATYDAAVISGMVPMVQVWANQIAVLCKAIGELETRMKRNAKSHADWAIFDSLPGAGDVMVPRLLAAMGTRRERFEAADQLQCFTGIAPVKEASGKTEWVHMRWACPKFLRQTFHEWAACSIPFCGWAKGYYDQQKAKGNSHHTAVRALAFKWMRILYACWRDRQPYQEEVYLASLAKRRISIPALAKAVKMP